MPVPRFARIAEEGERRVGDDDVRPFQKRDTLGAPEVTTGVFVVSFQGYCPSTKPPRGSRPPLGNYIRLLSFTLERQERTPAFWVAQGKHANYASQASCNSGGSYNSDTCVNNATAVRVEYSGAYNLGSRSRRFRDCVTSRNPMWQWYGTGKTECYWRDGDLFRGWYPDNIGGGHASPYSGILASLGFGSGSGIP